MKFSLVILFVSFLFIINADNVVKTPSGSYQGFQGQNFVGWLGIPFSEPPVGDSRWKNPVAPKPFNYVMNTTTYKPACPQSDFYVDNNPSEQSEDCLYLNIYSPQNYQNNIGKLPVMVWIYGGGFITGFASDPFFKGDYFANTTNTIIVTINYRLGMLGFLSGNNLDGNFGIWDQILALKWVQTNIENFGGDKSQVTIFGQSAGAISVSIHLTTPESSGLFSRAIVESNPFGLQMNNKTSMQVRFDEVVEKLDCLFHIDALSCMRKKNFTEILQVQGKTVWTPLPVKITNAALQWEPVIDNKLIFDQPYNLMKQNKTNKVDSVIFGNVQNESIGFVDLVFKSDYVSSVDYLGLVNLLFGSVLGKQVLELYPDNGGNNKPILYQMVTDWIFYCPTRKAAGAMSDNKIDTRLYHWLYNPYYDPFNTKLPNCNDYQGACHSAEVDYVFQSLDFSNNHSYHTPEEYQLSLKAMSLWSNFSHWQPLVVDGTEWKQYDPVNRYGLKFDVPTVTLIQDYRANECDFWNSN